MGVSARGRESGPARIGLVQRTWSYAAKDTTMPSSSGWYPSFGRALIEPERKTPAAWIRKEW
jgi:hypothetical protein